MWCYLAIKSDNYKDSLSIHQHMEIHSDTKGKTKKYIFVDTTMKNTFMYMVEKINVNVECYKLLKYSTY